MFTRRPASTVSRPATIVQRSILQRAVAGDKTVFTNLTQERATALGFTYVPTSDEVAQYNVEQLYEMAYGGNAQYFDSPKFDVPRAEEAKFLTGATKNVNVVESIYTCSVCQYQRIVVNQGQFRSGDESLTSQYRCIRCGHFWKQS